MLSSKGELDKTAAPSQRHFSAVVTICSGKLLHRGGSHFSSSIWYTSFTAEEFATSGAGVKQ